ncbi:MAG: hypothetical protein IKH86_01185 [Prevotella sp.]|nr:hypothetical protein [Prevotella sp.]
MSEKPPIFICKSDASAKQKWVFSKAKIGFRLESSESAIIIRENSLKHLSQWAGTFFPEKVPSAGTFFPRGGTFFPADGNILGKSILLLQKTDLFWNLSANLKSRNYPYKKNGQESKKAQKSSMKWRKNIVKHHDCVVCR